MDQDTATTNLVYHHQRCQENEAVIVQNDPLLRLLHRFRTYRFTLLEDTTEPSERFCLKLRRSHLPVYNPLKERYAYDGDYTGLYAHKLPTPDVGNRVILDHSDMDGCDTTPIFVPVLRSGQSIIIEFPAPVDIDLFTVEVARGGWRPNPPPVTKNLPTKWTFEGTNLRNALWGQLDAWTLLDTRNVL